MSSEAVSVQSEFQKINSCAKRPTDIWTNYLYYTFSLRLVYLIRKTRITPNMLTLTALVLVLIGCGFYATGLRADIIWGLILIQISYVFDCADGQLARYKQLYSPVGGWLDQTADRIKEFAVFFSLAYGYTRFHPGNTSIWMWAMVALFALYLLEYFGQIEMFRVRGLTTRAIAKAVSEGADTVYGAKISDDSGVPEHPAAAESDSVDEPASPQADSFSRMQRLRSFIPFRSFIIGEQYFVMLVFIAFGWIYSYFVFVSIVGLLMAIYRPMIDFIKFRRQGAQV